MMLAVGRRLGIARAALGRAAFRGASKTSSEGTADAPSVSNIIVHRGASTARSLFEGYTELLREYPLRTNAAVSGALCAVGDGLAQLCESKLDLQSPNKETYNVLRTARMAIFGTLKHLRPVPDTLVPDPRAGERGGAVQLRTLRRSPCQSAA